MSRPDPLSDSTGTEMDNNWLMLPMKCWPLWIRLVLIGLLSLVLWWISTMIPNQTNVPVIVPAIEQSSALQAPMPEMTLTAPTINCTGPFVPETTSLRQYVCAEPIGVERHEIDCTSPTCSKWRRGCPTVDENDQVLFLLMPGEFIAILSDGRMIRSDGPRPENAAVLECADEAPP